MQVAASKRLMSLKEAGKYLGLCEWSVRQMVLNGDIPFIKGGVTGKKYLIDIADLDVWIDENKMKIRY